jgi:hypothetical protein
MIAVHAHQRRRGAATVEFAVVLPLLCLFLAGIWEMGRFVEATHVLTMAAREGARYASIGQYTTATAGTIQISLGSGVTGAPYNTVSYVVEEYLKRMGYTTTTPGSFKVEFANKDAPLLLQPYQATKGQMIHVRVRLNFSDVRWSLTNIVAPGSWVINSGDYLDQGTWASMEDEPFTLNADIASGYPYSYPYRTN